MTHNLIARGRGLALILSVFLILTSSQALAATPVASPVASDLEPVIPLYQDEFAGQLADMPHYALVLTLDPTRSTIGGTAIVTFPNRTGMTLTELPFRLYPNATYYGEGATEITAIEIDGEALAPRLDESGTVLFVDLPAAVSPGETMTVELAFETVIPRNTSGSFGILNYDTGTDRFALADWYPIVAGWDETGWRLEPPTEQGDPTFSTTSLYDLNLSLPQGYEVIASGDETTHSEGSVRVESGPVREFAMVIAKGLERLSDQAGETTVGVYADPAHSETAQQLLDTATAALGFYNENFGSYPFRELDFAEAALSLAYGVSWSGLLFINNSQLAISPDNLATLDFTVFHETGHQWWGGTVGANSNDHTFMVEGLTNATALLAQAEIQGADAATNSLYAWIVTPYLNLLSGYGDGVPDTSIFDQPATAPLSTLAYGKGALGFLAIRDQIGDAAFREALASYAESFRLAIAEPEDLLAAFETASGQQLDDLWHLWFESADVTPADVEALVPRIVASFG